MPKEVSHKEVCQKGGRSKSPKKLKAVCKNLKKAREQKAISAYMKSITGPNGECHPPCESFVMGKLSTKKQKP